MKQAGDCGEYICGLLGNGYGLYKKSGALKMMSNKVTIVLDVFRPFIKNIIENNLDNIATITVKKSGIVLRGPHIYKGVNEVIIPLK